MEHKITEQIRVSIKAKEYVEKTTGSGLNPTPIQKRVTTGNEILAWLNSWTYGDKLNQSCVGQNSTVIPVFPKSRRKLQTISLVSYSTDVLSIIEISSS